MDEQNGRVECSIMKIISIQSHTLSESPMSTGCGWHELIIQFHWPEGPRHDEMTVSWFDDSREGSSKKSKLASRVAL